VDDTDPIRAAGLLLRRGHGGAHRWLLLRARKHGEWGFPKGHADPGEDDLACALRECAEECGIALLAVDGIPRRLRYRLGDGRLKQVTYFPARTATSAFALSREHRDGGWFPAREVLDRLPHPSLRALFHGHLADLLRRRD
jgi:8-oxo-dGTP diphosphatase